MRPNGLQLFRHGIPGCLSTISYDHPHGMRDMRRAKLPRVASRGIGLLDLVQKPTLLQTLKEALARN